MAVTLLVKIFNCYLLYIELTELSNVYRNFLNIFQFT